MDMKEIDMEPTPRPGIKTDSSQNLTPEDDTIASGTKKKGLKKSLSKTRGKPNSEQSSSSNILSETEGDLDPLPVKPPPPSSDSSHTSEEDNLGENVSSYKILEAFKKSVDSRIDNLNRQFEGLADEMSSVQAIVDKDIKMRSLEWAMDNVTKYGVFKYRHAKIEPNTIYESADLVRSVLMWFRKGFGTPIDNDIYISDKRWENPSAVEKELFRDKLSEHIFQLTGRKPRLVRKNGKFIIHYS